MNARQTCQGQAGASASDYRSTCHSPSNLASRRNMVSANSMLLGSVRDRSKSRNRLKKKSKKQLVDRPEHVNPAMGSLAMIPPASPLSELQCGSVQRDESHNSRSILSSAKAEGVGHQDLGEAPIASPSRQASNAIGLERPNPAPDTVSQFYQWSTQEPIKFRAPRKFQHDLASTTDQTPMGKLSYATAGSTRLGRSTNEDNSQDASCDLVHSSYAAAATAGSDSSLQPNTVKSTTLNAATTNAPESQPAESEDTKKRRKKKGQKRNTKKVGRSTAPYLSNPKASNTQAWSRHPNRQQRFATDYDRGFSVSGHRRFDAKKFNEHWEDVLPGMYL